MEKNKLPKEEVKQLIEKGCKCWRQFGLSWKGAGKKEISKEEALKLLPKYNYGVGYYELELLNNNTEVKFTEYSESDMF